MSHQLLRQSKIVTSQLKKDTPDFDSGSVVEVHYKIKEGEKERIQIFKGIVISRHKKNDLDATFTVLKNATAGIKVERTFPVHSPFIEKIVVVEAQRARRSKLYYLKEIKDPIKSVRAKPLKVNK
jgi:large subunit ribosomal protein L19